MFSYRPQLITILNSFIRLHPDYRGIVYDQTCDPSFHLKLKSNYCNTGPLITNVLRRTSK